jgi:hypothetical protein
MKNRKTAPAKLLSTEDKVSISPERLRRQVQGVRSKSNCSTSEPA